MKMQNGKDNAEKGGWSSDGDGSDWSSNEDEVATEDFDMDELFGPRITDFSDNISLPSQSSPIDLMYYDDDTSDDDDDSDDDEDQFDPICPTSDLSSIPTIKHRPSFSLAPPPNLRGVDVAGGSQTQSSDNRDPALLLGGSESNARDERRVKLEELEESWRCEHVEEHIATKVKFIVEPTEIHEDLPEHFEDLCTYRRCLVVEQWADKQRFLRQISKIENSIGWVFDPIHRKKKYREHHELLINSCNSL